MLTAFIGCKVIGGNHEQYTCTDFQKDVVYIY